MGYEALIEKAAKNKLEEFINTVAKMRSAQRLHKDTMQYGYRSVATRASNKVDSMLDEILGEGWEKTAWKG